MIQFFCLSFPQLAIVFRSCICTTCEPTTEKNQMLVTFHTHPHHISEHNINYLKHADFVIHQIHILNYDMLAPRYFKEKNTLRRKYVKLAEIQ